MFSCPGRLHQERNKARSLVSFLCGSCHSFRSIDIGYEENIAAESYEELKKILATSSYADYADLDNCMRAYLSGVYSVETMYTNLSNDFFPALKTTEDEEAWKTFYLILNQIEDPVRRVNLYLRYLRDHPRVHTLCCNRSHCFRCKTVDFHVGETCWERLNALDNTIVNCPHCDIAIVKGDGCNNVTCICGYAFGWSDELLHGGNCREFINKYPSPKHNPTEVCAALLCHDPVLQTESSSRHCLSQFMAT